MRPVRYALLSLLAHEPLTGYDLVRYLETRLAPFWPIGYNQVYPELARLEEEGFVKHLVEQNSYRPAKKVYEMTPSGMELLRQWAQTPGGSEVHHDEFLLKMYNLWLLEPEQACLQINEQRALHVQRATYYEGHIEELKSRMAPDNQGQREPHFASIVTLRHGLSYERHYIAWCDHMLNILQLPPDEMLAQL